MSLSREQMVDYLYGELQGEALDEFEAALRESEHSRRELAELQATLRAAREELARDVAIEPPARVRDAVLKAAQLQLIAAKDAALEDAPGSSLQRILRWLRSVWILPSLVAATAAALLVFRQHEHELTPDGPTPASSMEVVQPEPHARSAAPEPAGASDTYVPAPSAAAEGSSSGAATPEPAAPQAAAPRPARRSSAPRGTSGERFAAPPAGWQRGPSADTAERAPSPSAQAPAPTATRSAQAPSAERRESTARQPFEASPQSSALGSARARSAAPAPAAPSSGPSARGDEAASAAPSSTPLARRAEQPPAALSSTPPAPRAESAAEAPAAADSSARSARGAEVALEPPPPLPVAGLEQRAREHMAAKRWAKAAADYRELLRRFPQDPRRKLWTEQLQLALRAGAQPKSND